MTLQEELKSLTTEQLILETLSFIMSRIPTDDSNENIDMTLCNFQSEIKYRTNK